MDEALEIINREKEKIAIANKKKDVAILKQALEPIEAALGELKETIEESIALEKKEKPEQVYFDKEFNSKLAASLDKVFNLISKFKLPEPKPLDLSPIATEIKKQNENIIALLNKPNQSEELQKLITALVGKQNSFLEREFKQFDYSEQLKSISEGVNKNNERVEKLTVKRDDLNLIKEVIPIYKK